MKLMVQLEAKIEFEETENIDISIGKIHKIYLIINSFKNLIII